MIRPPLLATGCLFSGGHSFGVVVSDRVPGSFGTDPVSFAATVSQFRVAGSAVSAWIAHYSPTTGDSLLLRV